MFAQKTYFIINFICLIHKACQILSALPISVNGQCLLSSQPMHLHFSHSPNIPNLFSVIPQPTTIRLIHCIGYQHFLKPFAVTSGEMWWQAVMIHTNQIHLYFFIYKLTWMSADSQFSPQMVLLVLRVLNTCVPDFCVMSVVWSVSVQSSIMVFNLWIRPGFIFESCS